MSHFIRGVMNMNEIEYVTAIGESAKIIPVSDSEAEVHVKITPNAEDYVKYRFIKYGTYLYKVYSDGIEIGPLCEGLKTTGYYIKSDKPAAEIVAKELGVF